MKKPMYATWPKYDQEIIKAVQNVLKSGRTNQWVGDHVYAFEKEYAEYLGVKHAIAMANGTVSLDVALRVLGIGSGDEVIVTCRSFVASASTVGMSGAVPIFCDVDPVSGNMTAESIQAVMTPKTRAVIAVHLAGWPCEMDSIVKLCRKNKLALIEDCAQAHGATYRGQPVGSFGDFASFSFCQDKIFSTGGEGGLLVTNKTALWKQAWSMKDHGRDFDVVFNQKSGTSFKWMVNSFGSNYRMSEMQAAIGRIFLQKLDEMVAQRRKHANRLNDAFKQTRGLCINAVPDHIEHAYYKYYVQIDTNMLKSRLSRDTILSQVSGQGIPCGSGSCAEIYREKAFKQYRKQQGYAPQKRLPVARKLGDTSIMLQVHPNLTPAWIDYVIQTIRKVVE